MGIQKRKVKEKLKNKDMLVCDRFMTPRLKSSITGNSQRKRNLDKMYQDIEEQMRHVESY